VALQSYFLAKVANLSRRSQRHDRMMRDRHGSSSESPGLACSSAARVELRSLSLNLTLTLRLTFTAKRFSRSVAGIGVARSQVHSLTTTSHCDRQLYQQCQLAHFFLTLSSCLGLCWLAYSAWMRSTLISCRAILQILRSRSRIALLAIDLDTRPENPPLPASSFWSSLVCRGHIEASHMITNQ
jgi:hypothetical protein